MYDQEKLIMEGKLDKAFHHIHSLETKQSELKQPEDYLNDTSSI